MKRGKSEKLSEDRNRIMTRHSRRKRRITREKEGN